MRFQAVLLVAIASLTACSATDNSDPGIAFAAGTYVLTSVNGQALPFTEQSGTPLVKLTGGQFVARKDGTFTQTSLRTTTTSGTGTTPSSKDRNGTYSVGGQVISFLFLDNAESGLGSHTPTTLSLALGQVTYEYTRQ
ncbi:MAG: hypothetical protein ABIP93_20470 [Gemmatimonadaceae bacterium]